MDAASKTPWHLWVVGILALVWNGGGGLDYIMTQSENEGYLSQFTPEQRAFFTSIPVWAVSTWALSVWGAVLGSILLLFRSRYAVTCFGVAIITFLITAIYTHGLAEPKITDVVGTGAAVFSVIIFLITTALWLYSRWMRTRGVLR